MNIRASSLCPGAAILIIGLQMHAALGASPAATTLLTEFEPSARTPFSAEAGSNTWMRDLNGRSCTSCHSASVLVSGRHERTGKVIEPMAPSVNPARLTDVKKVRKWFKRNCKWTFGRECTAQEKGDILVWLSDQ